MNTSTEIKNTLSFVTQILTQDVLPFFDQANHQYSITDMSAITSKFLILQQSIVDLYSNVNTDLELNLTNIQNLIDNANLGGGGGSSASIKGAFNNLKITTTGLDSNVTVTIGEIVLKNDTNQYQTISGVSINANTLDIGILSASTWYAVHIATDGVTPIGLLSLSENAPTLPTGYTFSARVGWIRTDSTVNKFPLPIIQVGKNVQYKVTSGSNLISMRQMSTGILGNITTPVWSALDVTQFVPSTASSVDFSMRQSAAGVVVMAPNNSYGAYNSTTNPPPVSGVNAVYQKFRFILESSNVYIIANVANQSFCMGWEDNI